MEAPPPMPPDGDVITGPHYIIAIIVTTVLAVLITWLRMYVRIFMSRNPGWDDYTMFAASVSYIFAEPTGLLLADKLMHSSSP